MAGRMVTCFLVNPRIAQLNVSNGGVPKRAVSEATVTVDGVLGDHHRDLEEHGGPMRAVCLYSREVLDALAAEGHAAVPGALGENITVEGLDWAAVVPGTRLKLGDEVVVEVTSYCAPCRTLRHVFKDERFDRVSQKTHPGFSRVYAKVLTPGQVRAGAPVAWV